jgi:uncharacterized protein (TIGR02246 family)
MSRSLLLAAIAALACTPPPDLDAERAAIMAADSAWLAAAQAGDVDSALSFWTDDAWVIAPEQPPYRGREAIRAMLVESMNIPGFSVSWHTTDVVVAPSGDVAWSVGTNAFTVPGEDGGLDTLRGQGVVVWQKGAEGRWRSAVDIWNARP